MKIDLRMLASTTFVIVILASAPTSGRQVELGTLKLPIVENVETQPLLAQALRLEQALRFLGSALQVEDATALRELRKQAPTPAVVRRIQEILDPYVLAMLEINPEARVEVRRGAAPAVLREGGWTSYLVKVHNQAHVTARVNVESPNSAPAFHSHEYNPSETAMEHEAGLTPGQTANRFLQAAMYTHRPLKPNLSGLTLEYAVVQLYSKEAGKRDVELSFNVGAGTQDIGFRNAISILFDVAPAVTVRLHVTDTDGEPIMASFVISDGIERELEAEASVAPGEVPKPPGVSYEWLQEHYREALSRIELQSVWERPLLSKKLVGLYPLPARRVATQDTYPDFYFQPQIYRGDGEYVPLAPGTYDVTIDRGPEYIAQHRRLTVPEGVESMEFSVALERWVHMADSGWYSSDHHIHSAGCQHYDHPSEGVLPEHMWRQMLGEDLNIGNVLIWGPGWDYQKQFFTGDVHPLSTTDHLIRYDVEVSGHPSSHAGHLSLLNLTGMEYPGAKKLQDWPSWTLPVLTWAKRQGAITGYAHSGWGLEPVESTTALPNCVTPRMDGIGANEYIVTLAHDLVDFYSVGDTAAPWELNMWYHSLNLGFRPRLSAETDFPCIYDERIGLVRSYTRIEGDFDYAGFIDGIVGGHSYVSDGMSHIVDFRVNGVEMGIGDSTLALQRGDRVSVEARVIALLPEAQDEAGASIAAKPLDQQPYWHIERARIGKSRTVAVELVVNGNVVTSRNIEADGKWRRLYFEHHVDRSSWLALRIYPAAHTNPVFVTVDGAPIRSRDSADWAIRAVDQAWKMKSPQIRAGERDAAERAYATARRRYGELMAEAGNDRSQSR